MHRLIATATLALALAAPMPGWTQEQSRPGVTDMPPAEREILRAEIRAYLLENPEVIMEAVNILEARRAAEAVATDSALIAANREALYNDPNSWVGGNPDGDVTLVEFSDYRCGFCKRAHPVVKRLLKNDPNLRLVIKEFPILGPDSVAAARVAAAALDLNRENFGALNDALMSFDGALTEDTAYRIAVRAGYDLAALKERAKSAEIEARIADNYAVARALGLEGTPSFILGERIIRGFLPFDEMVTAVAEARATIN